MIGSIIGAGVSLASSMIGGMNAARQAEKAEREAENQRRKNEQWFNRIYNENYLQTAEAQYALTKAREAAAEQMAAARGRSVVMGTGTEEIDAANRASNQLMSDTLAQLGAQGTARKDAALGRYLEADNQMSKDVQNTYMQRAQAATQAANEGMKAGMGMVNSDMSSYLNTGKSLFSNLFQKK